MPWNNQSGGGPWGSPGGGGGGGQNPWGRGPSGPQPPNLEDLLRRSQDQVKRFLPGGFGGSRGFAIVAALLVLVWLATGFYRVEPAEQGVVLRFGEYNRITDPGLRYHLPYPIETVITPNVERVNRMEIGFRSAGAGDGRRATGERDVPDESLMLTGDENIIDIDFVVFWRIKPDGAGDYLFRIRYPENTVRKAAESAIREVIGRTEIQPALTEARQEIELSTRQLLQTMLDEYHSGVLITQLQLLKVDPPQPVVDAFNDVQRARADRERLRNEAEAYRNDVIPRARGEAERLNQESAAYREQIVAQANGDAQRFISVHDAYQQAKDVTTQRIYLETMEQILRNSRKVIIDSNAEGAQGVIPYLPLNELQPRAAPRPAPAPAPAAPSRPGGQPSVTTR